MHGLSEIIRDAVQQYNQCYRLIEELDVKAARDLLIAAQQKAEDEYIETE